MSKLPQTTSSLLLGVLVVNVIGLWTVYLLSKPAEPQPSSVQQEVTEVQLKPSPTTVKENLVATDSREVKELREQLDEVSAAVATLTAQTTQAETVATETETNNQAREYVVYLGSGSSTKLDWTTIEGTKINLNSANYPNFEQAVFQASLKTMGGEAQARLINITTGGVFYQTEVTHNTSTTTWKSSSPFQLNNGAQEYAVQLRSSSGELAELVGARLIITTR